MTITGNFIGGKTVISSSNETMPVYDPATGKAVREVTVSTAQEVSEAIQVARDAFDSWSRTTPLRRARVLFNFKMLLEQHVEELAGIIVSEHGKVWSDALGELTRGMEVVEFACGIPHLIKGEYSSDVGTGVDSYSLMQPRAWWQGSPRLTSRRWCRCGCSAGAGLRQQFRPQAARAGADGRRASGRAAERGRSAGRRV